MARDERARRTVRFPPARGPGGGQDIVAIFGLPAGLSTQGPAARAVTGRAVALSRETGDPVEVDLEELEAAAAADAALPRVPVVVADLYVEDGTTRPAVGDVVDYPVMFVETEDADDELAAEWAVRVEPLDAGGSRRSRPMGGSEHGPRYWPVLLHGPGWSATWHAPRPVAGPSTVRGRLLAVLDGGGRPDASVRGRVARLWVISQTVDRSGGNRTDPSRIVPGSRRLHPVPISPRWFDRGRGRPDERPAAAPPAGSSFAVVDPPPPPSPWVCETGVLVELDLACRPAPPT